MVLGATQRVKVHDKVMTQITLFFLIVDIIRILWISTFRGYYPHFVDIICIFWILWIYPNFVDIICIGHITIYLARSIRPIFNIYSYSVSGWCIPWVMGITYGNVFRLPGP